MDISRIRHRIKSLFPRIFLAIIYFCVFYFGFLFLISSSVQDGRYYIPFIAKYFNVPDIWRNLLFRSSQTLLKMLGFNSEIDGYRIGIVGGSSVRLVYSCLAYFYHSFWIAIVLSFETGLRLKLFWILIGTVSLFLLNIGRISGLLLILNFKKWDFMLGIDHHHIFDFFAIIAIIFLFFIMLKFKRARGER